MNNIISEEDMQFFLSQNAAETDKIIAGMRAVIDGNEKTYEAMKNQKWYQRIWNTVTGKNKMTVEEMSRNNDKLSAYCVQTLSLILQQKSVSDNMITALANSMYNMNMLRVNLENLVGEFVKKLDEKIISVDSYNNLITDIQNDKFDKNTSFVSLLDILSRIDKRTSADAEKLTRLRDTLIKNGFDINANITVQELTRQIFSINENSVGRIYLLCQGNPKFVCLNYCRQIIENYFYQPKSNRSVIKDSIQRDAMAACGLTDTSVLDIRAVYNDIEIAIADNFSRMLNEQTTANENANMVQTNIMLLGLTGAGKSTLINAVIGSDFAETGIGGVVTNENKVYSKTYGNTIFNFHDTIGFEMDTHFNENLINKIIKQNKSINNLFDLKRNIIWYCVQATGRKLLDFEVDIIRELKNLDIPIILVMTKCLPSKNNIEFENNIREILNSLNLFDIPIVHVLAVDWEITIDNETKIIKSMGLEKLIEFTTEMIGVK